MLLFFQTIRKPVFIIPGLGGSVLYNKQTMKEIWPPSFFSLFNQQEFISNFKVSYDDNNFISDIPIVTGPIGSCESINIIKKWMVPILKNEYFHTFIHSIENEHDIYCFPYDFRIIGNKDYLGILNKSLKESIERQKEKVILISHSLGGMFLHQFLLEQTLEWKKNHIDKLITINCPYGGSIESFNVLLNNKINKPILNKIDYVENISPFLWLIPNPYTEPPQLLFQNKTMKVYNHNISTLLEENIWERIQYHFKDLQENIKKDVNVPTYIIHSTGIPTKQFITSSSNQTLSPSGDGLIHLDSLTLPKHYWKNIHFIEIPNEEHTEILKSPTLIELLKKLISL